MCHLVHAPKAKRKKKCFGQFRLIVSIVLDI